jgi:sulfatase maturation enzyme AslB (radical SAM superfamily)
MLSSAWETEQRQHNMIEWNNPKNGWMVPEVKKQIEKFQDQQIEKEFSDAVEEHRVEEIYWVGGEPLMYEQHWRYMTRIIELGDGPNVYARYNTNLSRVDYKGINLYSDILSGIRDWQICASLDGTGEIGEYIRTGLNYNQWLENFSKAVEVRRNRRQVRVDFTLTLPGMFEVTRIEQLAQQFGVEVLAKVIFSFSPDIVMSPLALPREILHPWVDEIISQMQHSGALRDILVQLKTRPTFAEQWPNEYREAIARGKARVLKLEQIRTQSVTMTDILSARPDVLEWWMQIES